MSCIQLSTVVRTSGQVVSRFDHFSITVVLAVSAALCAPLAHHYWFDSHDGYSYVMRVVEFASALRDGDLYPRWASDFYGGYGAPFFVFYAPLAFAGSAVLSELVGSVVLALKLWVLLVTAAAGVGTYLVVRAETQRSDAGLLAALLYLAAPYRITDLYVRGDIAEYTAISCLPWAIWAYRSVAREAGKERSVQYCLAAVIAHAALVFGHAILGLWGTLLLGLVNLASSWALWQRKAPRQIALLWASFGFALALSAVYTLPALVQKHYVQIHVMNTGYLNPSLQLLTVRRLFQQGQFFIGPLVAAAVVLALGTFLFKRGSRTALLWALTSLIGAAASTIYAEVFWDLRLPLTGFIQFAWRLHGPASLALALSIGFAWAALLRPGVWRDAGALAVGSGALLLALPLVTIDKPLEAGSFPETAAAIREGIHHTTASDEYLPVAVPERPQQAAPQVASGSSEVDLVSVFSRGTRHEIEVEVERATSLRLALHLFPGWQVRTVQGPGAVSIERTPDGLAALRFPHPGRYSVLVHFGTSPLRLACGLFSVFAGVAAFPALYWLNRRRFLGLRRRDRVFAPSFSTRRGLA